MKINIKPLGNNILVEPLEREQKLPSGLVIPDSAKEKAKQIIYAEEAREKLKSGIDKLARAVVTTLGPKGRNVAIDKKWGAPNVVHDGVTVAKEIELEDPFENMGAQLVKE